MPTVAHPARPLSTLARGTLGARLSIWRRRLGHSPLSSAGCTGTCPGDRPQLESEIEQRNRAIREAIDGGPHRRSLPKWSVSLARRSVESSAPRLPKPTESPTRGDSLGGTPTIGGCQDHCSQEASSEAS